MIFHKRNSGNRCFNIHKPLSFAGYTFRVISDLSFIRSQFPGAYYFAGYHYIVIEIQGTAYNQPQAYLSHDLKLTGQSLFILFKYFDIIIQEANQSQPNGREQDEPDIYIGYLCK